MQPKEQPDAPQPTNRPEHPPMSATPSTAPVLPADGEWLNAAEPLRQDTLRGRWVLLDFWSYG
jgi:hypothetical protein